jgi:choline-sulfatase
MSSNFSNESRIRRIRFRVAGEVEKKPRLARLGDVARRSSGSVASAVLASGKRILACAPLLGAACADAHRDAAVDPGAPVVLISIDTLRSDRLAVYGYRGGATPAIDALRRDAILAERAYTHAPLTLPAHVSLLSGLLPAEHGVRDNLGYPVEPVVPLLSRRLADHGYATAGAVSAAVLRASTGIAAGFEHWSEPGDAGDASSPRAADGAGPRAADGAGPRAERPGGDTMRSILPWLRQVADRPFFLFFHLYEPHAPYQPAAPFDRRFESAYDGEVAAADQVVGELLDALRALGAYDRALIVLVSDHGEGLGDHGEREHGVFLYREALQVPLLLKLPRSRLGGTTITAPAQLVDVVPTVLAAVGVEPPTGLRGASLLTLDADASASAPRHLFAETLYPRIHFGWSELRSVISGGLHFIDAPQPELYDVVADPGERATLLERERASARALRAAIDALPQAVAEPRPESPETRRRLAALGYLNGGGVAAAGAAGAAGDTGAALPDPKTQLAVLASLEAALADRESLAEGRAAASAGQIDRALEVLAPLADRGDRAAAIALATALSEAGRQDEALAAAQRALALGPDDALVHETIGLVRLRRGEQTAAIAPLRRAVELDPALVNAWNLLGVALQRGAGDVDGALDAWQRALALAPGRFDVLYNLGTVAAATGRTELARSSLARFAAEAPAAAWAPELSIARERLRSLGGAPP